MIETASRIGEERLKSNESRIQNIQQILARLVLQQETFSPKETSQSPLDAQPGITPSETNRLAQNHHADSAQDVLFVEKNAIKYASVTRKGTEDGLLIRL